MKVLSYRGIPARVLDHLETDGGWLTTAALADLTGCQEASVGRALWRLRVNEMVEMRSVAMAFAEPPLGTGMGNVRRNPAIDTRYEWRFVSWRDCGR